MKKRTWTVEIYRIENLILDAFILWCKHTLRIHSFDAIPMNMPLIFGKSKIKYRNILKLDYYYYYRIFKWNLQYLIWCGFDLMQSINDVSIYNIASNMYGVPMMNWLELIQISECCHIQFESNQIKSNEMKSESFVIWHWCIYGNLVRYRCHKLVANFIHIRSENWKFGSSL